MTDCVTLRDVVQDDLPTFFEHLLDPGAVHMAAFTPKEPSNHDAFLADCNKILADPEVLMKTILVDGTVAGNITSFVTAGEREVGYWIGRDFWGRGVATAALAAFLEMERRRPLLAYSARDNAGSIRVLEKCGFQLCAEGRAFANARGAEIDELIFCLDAANS